MTPSRQRQKTVPGDHFFLEKQDLPRRSCVHPASRPGRRNRGSTQRRLLTAPISRARSGGKYEPVPNFPQAGQALTLQDRSALPARGVFKADGFPRFTGQRCRFPGSRGIKSEIAKRLRPGQLVALESTTYPGTTQEVILPRLEATGLKVGQEYFLAFSPERVDPGNKRYTTKNTSKVVGGITPACLDVAYTFYAQTIRHVVPVSSPAVAEMTKVFEMKI